MTISIFTLGCKTNYYESLQIVANLCSSGYDAFDGLKRADVFVINTCAITSEAEKKSRQAISRARKLNPFCHIIVVGCASQKNSSQFLDLPNVVLIKGVSQKEKLDKILSQIEKIDGDTKKPHCQIFPLPNQYLHSIDAAQQRTRSFIKIQDGCNNFCSYCIVPYLRGASRSKQIDDIVREVKAANSKETVLIGIDISQYGKDIGTNLSQLFDALRGIDTRFRLGSLEHSVVSDQVLKSLKNLDFCQHFHLSLQSGSDTVLARMNRHYTTKQFFEGIQKIRSFFPDAALTTDIIVGFCDETDEEFFETLQFVQKCQFADIHVFPYSPRQGTKAYQLADIDSATKRARTQQLLQVKHDLHKAFLTQQIGQTAQVLVETKSKGMYTGYTKNYTKVYLQTPAEIGSIIEVTLTELFLDGMKGI